MGGPADVHVAPFDGGRTWGAEEGFELDVKSLMNVKMWAGRSWRDDSDEKEFRMVCPGPQRRLFPRKVEEVWTYQHSHHSPVLQL